MLMLIKTEELLRLLTLGDMLRETVDSLDLLPTDAWQEAEDRIACIQNEAKPMLNDFVIQWGAVLEHNRDEKLRVREFADVKM